MSDDLVNRRRCLLTLAGLGLTTFTGVGPPPANDEEAAGRARVLDYLETLARPGGGYGWPA